MEIQKRQLLQSVYILVLMCLLTYFSLAQSQEFISDISVSIGSVDINHGTEIARLTFDITVKNNGPDLKDRDSLFLERVSINNVTQINFGNNNDCTFSDVDLSRPISVTSYPILETMTEYTCNTALDVDLDTIEEYFNISVNVLDSGSDPISSNNIAVKRVRINHISIPIPIFSKISLFIFITFILLVIIPTRGKFINI